MNANIDKQTDRQTDRQTDWQTGGIESSRKTSVVIGSRGTKHIEQADRRANDNGNE